MSGLDLLLIGVIGGLVVAILLVGSPARSNTAILVPDYDMERRGGGGCAGTIFVIVIVLVVLLLLLSSPA